MTTRVGSLKTRLTISRASQASDGMGDFVTTWADVGDRMASVQSLRGGEEVQSARLNAIENLQIKMRADALTRTLTAKDRLSDGNRTLNVKWVGDLEGRGRWIDVIAQAGGLIDG